MEQRIKSPILSKTMWGLLIAFVPDAINLIDKLIDTGIIPPEYAPIVRTVGLAIAAIGRWGARTPLSFNLKW